MNNTKRIKACRLCGSTELRSFFSLGYTPLANDLVENIGESKGKFLLDVVVCKHCQSHQLKHDVDPEILFANYLYSTPPALKRHFADFATEVVDKLQLKQGMRVLDIGGNNGTLIECFQQHGIQGVNIEPSSVYKESQQKGITTVHEFFSSAWAEEYVKTNGEFDCIVSSNVFAHSPTVADMIKGVEILLKKGGHFVMENAYLLDTIKNKDIGQIYHEHYHYHHIWPLFHAFSKRGLKLKDITFNKAQCGSFRLYVEAGCMDLYPSQSVCEVLENESEFFKSNEYKNFVENVEINGLEISDFLLKQLSQGKTVALFGVTAKVATILNYFYIDKSFYYAVDEAPLKQGKLIPGTEIPIYGVEELTKNKPDIVFIGAYNFADSIMERFKDLDVTWVVPLPEFKVYDRRI
jgi:SAM-dependent methyltransferase